MTTGHTTGGVSRGARSARRPISTGAGQVDAQAVADLLAVASHDLPLAHWLVAEPRERTAVLARYLRIWVDHALERGDIDTVTTNAGQLVAASVWLHHNPAQPSPVPYDYDDRIALACRAHAIRFHDLDTGIDACRPKDRPHNQLVHWGVHPEHRGRGYATSLLTIAHDCLDADRVPALHVHPATPAPNGPLRLHGYLPRRNPHPLPHHGPTLWPLWRNPTANRSLETDNGDRRRNPPRHTCADSAGQRL